VVVPFVGGFSLRVGERLLRLQRIVDQNDVGAASSQHAAGGGGEPISQPGGDELIVERKLRRRQLTDDGNVEVTGCDLREKNPPNGQHNLFERAAALSG
jgi:hypothetical protein